MESFSYSWPLLLSALVASGLAIYAWQKRAILGAIPIFFLTITVSVWCLGYAFELALPTLAAKLFCAKVEYLAIVFIPVLLLVFALQYTGRAHWISRRNLVMILILPLATLALVWTNEFHHLIWKQFSLDITGKNPGLIVTEYGPIFWGFWIYSYTLIFAGTVILIQAFFRSQGVYRKQSFALLIASFAPWVGNFLYFSGLNLFNHLDLTPFTFTIAIVFYSLGQFRFQFLDLVPIAREAIIESMNDAVIVLDTQNRVVDLNPAACAILGSKNNLIIGQPAIKVFSRRADLTSIYKDTLQMHTEIFEGDRVFDLRISPIYDRRTNLTARLIVLRDISERWHAEEAVQRAKDELELRVEERTAEIRAANSRLQAEISERITTAEALAYRLKLEGLIANVSTRFINLEPSETDQEIIRTLQLVSEFTNMNRSYVFLLSEDGLRMEKAYEWPTPGVIPKKDKLESIYVENFPWAMSHLRRLEPIHIPYGMNFPIEANPEKEAIKTQNVQSLVIIPIARSGCLVGFLGFDSTRESPPLKNWSNEDITLLKMVGEIFSNALQRRDTTEQLEASLHEKDLLIKEIHHRVKNNLQIISSLLNLQANTVNDPEILNVLRESQTRVRSMGLIHEKLYLSNNLAEIDFKGYIQNLTNYLFIAYAGQNKGIELLLDVDNVYLDIDSAVPCGLIITELVSNAFKYAYPDGSSGKIQVRLKKMEGTSLKLSVADEGYSFPDSLDIHQTSSLGLQLVCSLVDQLDGSIILNRTAGTCFEITFAIH